MLIIMMGSESVLDSNACTHTSAIVRLNPLCFWILYLYVLICCRSGEARESYIQDKESFGEFLEGSDAPFLVTAETVLAKADAAVTRCKLTKCETLCCRSLRDSRHKRSHLLKYTAAFSQETEQDWRRDMCPDLLSKISEILVSTTAIVAGTAATNVGEAA